MKSYLILAAAAGLAATAAGADTPSAPAVRVKGNVVDMSGAPAAAPVSGAKVLMLRTYVSDLDRSTKFYTAVFGMKVMGIPGMPKPKVGGDPAGAKTASALIPGPGEIRLLIFPGGSPGMMMFKGSGDASMMRASYLIQVPDLKASLAAAEANGGKVQPTRFTAGNQESRHVFDPDGNDLEILQSGSMGKPAK